MCYYEKQQPRVSPAGTKKPLNFILSDGKRKGRPATGRPSLQGRIVPTEALDSVKTFCRNLMSRKTGVSSDFSEINVFIFNDLQNRSTLCLAVPN